MSSLLSPTRQLELFNWVAEYYLCNIGEVLNVALPAGLKITSQSRIQLNPEFQYEDLLTEQEILVVEEIKKHQTLSYEEVERLLQKSNITSIIKSLVGKRAVILYEEVKERYKPKVARKIR
jgi:primosomal protein N' (replication factor Y)